MKILAAMLVGVIFLLRGIGYSQSDEYSDVVTLKNGNTVIGLITEYIPGKNVTLKTKSGSVFTFSYDEIDTMKKGGNNLLREVPESAKQIPVDSSDKSDQGVKTSKPKILFNEKPSGAKAASGGKPYLLQSQADPGESALVAEFGAGIGLPYGVFGGRGSVGNELITGDLGIGFIPLSWDPAFSLGGSLHFLDRYGTIRPKISALWSNACGVILLYDQGNSKVLFKQLFSGFALYGGLDIKFSRDSEYSIDINVGSVFTSVSPASMEEKFNAEKHALELRGYSFSTGSVSFKNFPKFSLGISYIIGRSSETE